MPIYEYRRPDGTTFDVMQSFSEAALTKDPETGVPVERVLHAPAIHFKGKGFHNTDYGTRKGNREKAASDAASKSDGGSSSSDSKSGDSGSSSSSGDSSSSSSKSDSGSSSSSDASKKKSGDSSPKKAA